MKRTPNPKRPSQKELAKLIKSAPNPEWMAVCDHIDKAMKGDGQ